MTATLTIDTAQDVDGLSLEGDERWHILLLRDGVPAARVDLASPGATVGPALLRAAVLRWGDWEAARAGLAELLRARMGFTAPAPAPLSCSVIVCSHRRPADLRRLLGALTELDPAPAEIVVVDNDPGEQDSRAEVLAAGARYVREDRRGLDNARNAGVRAAQGEVIVFIDDDCVPSKGWLARVCEEFANPAVGAVTGPAFPHVLDTAARRRMEVQASLTRGLHRTEFDWTIFPIAGAGAIGVGANMAFRRAALQELGPEPFPPELDAGTATESGGDTYAIAKLLTRGQRIVYDPATFIYHRHREDARALHRAVYGYGVGLSAALMKLLVEDRELSAPVAWTWVIGQYRRTQQRRLAGRADNVETRLSWDYLRGGLVGPGRWLRVRPQAAVSPAPASSPASVAARPRSMGAPAISVVVPTHERPGALARCLRALVAQDLAEPFEVVVVDDSREASAEIGADDGLDVRVLRTRGRGAAAARNAGAAGARAPLVLFIDDDVVAEPDLLRRHVERHERERGRGDRGAPRQEASGVAVVGSYLPRPAVATLAASAAALWWNDLFAALARATAPNYVGALSGNMSIARADFERVGGFDSRFGRYRREDWEWGLRALGAGLELRYEPAARSFHEYELTSAARLRAARLEGYGDVLLLREHPAAASAVLPLVGEIPHAGAGGPKRALLRAAWSSRRLRGATVAALALLERGKLRLLWVRLFNVAQRLSYERGVEEAGRSPREPVEEPLFDLDLDGREPISPPRNGVATIRVRVAGIEVARVRPALAQWTPELVEQILAQTPWAAVERAALARGCFPEWEEPHAQAARTHVLLGALGEEGDAARRAELEGAGAVVTMLAGSERRPNDADGYWRGVLLAAEREGRELVALTLPGVRTDDARWLDQALVAFDGARVGAIFGRGLADDAPTNPILLQSLKSAGCDRPLEAATALGYVVVRRELLAQLDPTLADCGPLAPLFALLEDLLQEGWVLGYRDVHGLVGEGPARSERARALTALRMRRGRLDGGSAGAVLRGELRRTTLNLAWHFVRRRERRTATRIYSGSLAGLLGSRAPITSSSAPSAFQRCSGTTMPVPPTGPSTRSG